MQRWIPIGLILLLGVGYVASEMVLRRGAYPVAEGAERANYDQLMAHMPGWMQAPLASRREILDLEASALAEEDPVKKAQILYKLASKVDSGSKQREYFRQVVELVPDLPLSARARFVLLSRQPDGAAVAEYLNYIDGCRFSNEGQIADVWQQGYGLAVKAPPVARLLYLTRMAEVPIIGPGFVDAYEDMQRLTFQLERADLRPIAEERLETCKVLEREMMEGRR